MLNTVLFLSLLILFVAVLIRDQLVSERQKGAEKLLHLVDQIKVEKSLKSQNQKELKSMLELSEDTDRKFLEVKLDLLSVEDDLEGMLPQLLN